MCGTSGFEKLSEVFDYAPLLEKLPKHHWDSLVWLMQCAEMCFEVIADHQVISHLHHAKKVVPFKTMSDTSNGSHSSSKYYGGIDIGTIVFLFCHANADFTMSISQIFPNGESKYHLNDDVVVYFFFPKLGVAVPLRPGDYLMFNALIPHAISSRYKFDNEIMCVWMYLKTAIVGLNNNNLELTTAQKFLADRYHSSLLQNMSSMNRQHHLKNCYKQFYNAL
jgi:hypothetical protein